MSGTFDLVLVEGCREVPIPKIEVLIDGAGPVSPDDTLLGVNSADCPGLTVPRFDPADVEGLAAFLERELSVRQA